MTINSLDMDIIKYDVYRGPNIGVYISVNDTIGLVPMGFAETKAKKLEEYLNIEIMYTAIANTRLIGSLSVMNNKGFLLPSTAYQDEFDYLKNEALNGNKLKTNNLLDSSFLEQDKSIFYLSSINQGLSKIKEGVILSKGKKIEEVIDKIKPPIFWKDRPIFISQLRKWNLKKINLALDKTYNLELMLKSNSNLNKEILIKKVIIDICNLASVA